MLAQALTEYESLICPGCGQPLWLSMDRSLERAWFSPDPHRCHACDAIEERVKSHRKGYEAADSEMPRSLRFSAELARR